MGGATAQRGRGWRRADRAGSPTVTVALGDTATFRVHFSNYLAETVTVTAHLLVFDADGVPISPTLATQTMAVAGNGSAVFTFLWPANDVPMGDFTAQTSVERQAAPLTGQNRRSSASAATTSSTCRLFCATHRGIEGREFSRARRVKTHAWSSGLVGAGHARS
jgi:hypothetical protein